MAAKPTPKPAPGRNSEGRTPEEQSDYEKRFGPKPKDTNPLMDWLSKRVKEASKPVKLKTTKKPVMTPTSGPTNMVMKKTALKKAVAKKKSVIPASPTK